MKVSTLIDKLGTYEQQKVDKTEGKDTRSGRTAGQDSDKVTLSSQARIYSEVQEAVREAPGIRAEKIAAIKARIEAGEYAPDAEKIAQKLLDEEEGLWF